MGHDTCEPLHPVMVGQHFTPGMIGDLNAALDHQRLAQPLLQLMSRHFGRFLAKPVGSNPTPNRAIDRLTAHVPWLISR
jgi:hypothetical protein